MFMQSHNESNIYAVLCPLEEWVCLDTLPGH